MKTKLNKRTSITLKSTAAAVIMASTAITTFALTTTAAHAERYDYGNSHYQKHNKHHKKINKRSNVDYAKVVSVQDVIERVEYSEPVETCTDKRVRIDGRHERPQYSKNSKSSYSSRTPDILGAVIGAAVGNHVGMKGTSSGRKVATVAGAILGGSIGRDSRKRYERKTAQNHAHYNDHYESDYSTVRYKTVRNCETTYETRYKNKVVGYDVDYRYRGQIYSTRMNERPGDRLKVRVKVTPIHS